MGIILFMLLFKSNKPKIHMEDCTFHLLIIITYQK